MAPPNPASLASARLTSTISHGLRKGRSSQEIRHSNVPRLTHTLDRSALGGMPTEESPTPAPGCGKSESGDSMLSSPASFGCPAICRLPAWMVATAMNTIPDRCLFPSHTPNPLPVPAEWAPLQFWHGSRLPLLPLPRPAARVSGMNAWCRCVASCEQHLLKLRGDRNPSLANFTSRIKSIQACDRPRLSAVASISLQTVVGHRPVLLTPHESGDSPSRRSLASWREPMSPS